MQAISWVSTVFPIDKQLQIYGHLKFYFYFLLLPSNDCKGVHMPSHHDDTYLQKKLTTL